MRRPLALLTLLCLLACHTSGRTKNAKPAGGLFDKLPSSTVALFMGAHAQEFWRDDLFGRFQFLTLLRFRATRGFFPALTEAATQGKLSTLGLDPKGETALVLDGELLTDSYQTKASTDRGLVRDVPREQRALIYLVLPIKDKKIFSQWLSAHVKEGPQSPPLQEGTIAKRPALFFSDDLIFIIEDDFAYVFPVLFSAADPDLVAEYPLSSLSLFGEALEAFFARSKSPLRGEALFQEARGKLSAEAPFFFMNSAKLAALLSQTKIVSWYRVYPQEGETAPHVEKDPPGRSTMSTMDAQSQALSFSSVVPWVGFSLLRQEGFFTIEGVAPITSLYQKEIEQSVQRSAKPLDWDLLFAGSAAYVAHFSLSHEALEDAVARSFFTAWGRPFRLFFTSANWRMALTNLQSLPLEKYLLENATGNMAFAIFANSKSAEQGLLARANLGEKGEEGLSIRRVGAINSVLSLFQVVSSSNFSSLIASSDGAVALQMKSPEAAAQLITALDALSAQTPSLATREGELRKLRFSDSEAWYLAAIDDVLLIGGGPKELQEIIAAKGGAERLSARWKAPFPFETSTTGAILDMDGLFSRLAKREEERQNPEDAAYYRTQMGHGPAWFSLRYADSAFYYTAQLP